MNDREHLPERIEYLFKLWDALEEIADGKMKEIFDGLDQFDWNNQVNLSDGRFKKLELIIVNFAFDNF